MSKADLPLQPIPIAYYAGDGCRIFNYDLKSSEEAQKWQVARMTMEKKGANGRIKDCYTPQRLFLDGKWSSDWDYENEAKYQFPSAAAAWEALKRAREAETQKQQQSEAIVADQIRKAYPLAPIDLDALLSPEGPYMRSNGHEDNAQLVDHFDWWAPVYGCDTLDILLNQIRDRILPHLRPPIAGIDVPGPDGDYGDLQELCDAEGVDVRIGAPLLRRAREAWKVAAQPASPEREQLAQRLDQLAEAVSKGQWSEFSMRVPAEPQRDADLVLSRAAQLLRQSPQGGEVQS